MRKATGPTDISALPMLESLEINIDPSLLEEALASVDRISQSRTAAESVDVEVSTGNSEEGGEIELELSTATLSAGVESVPEAAPVVRAPPAPTPGDDERRRLTLRVAAQLEAIRRLEESLARVTEIRDGLDTQVRELRKANRQHEADAAVAFQRSRRDRDEAERLAEERAIRGILDIVDNVERALVHADSADPARILSGLQMIAEQFRGALRKLNVERVVSSVGTPFDPAVHEAVLHLPTADVTEGGIVSEVAVGFILRGRLVRPSRVVVASAIAAAPTPPRAAPDEMLPPATQPVAEPQPAGEGE